MCDDQNWKDFLMREIRTGLQTLPEMSGRGVREDVLTDYIYDRRKLVNLPSPKKLPVQQYLRKLVREGGIRCVIWAEDLFYKYPAIPLVSLVNTYINVFLVIIRVTPSHLPLFF